MGSTQPGPLLPGPSPHRKCKPSSVRISTWRDRKSSSSCELCSSPGPVTPNISTWDRAGHGGQEAVGGRATPLPARPALPTLVKWCTRYSPQGSFPVSVSAR